MVRFYRPCMTVCWSANVTIAIPFASYLTLNNIVTLKLWLRGHSRSLKLVPFESLSAVSYLPSIVTVAVSVAVCEIFSVKKCVTLKQG